jgi:acyl carrier protein
MEALMDGFRGSRSELEKVVGSIWTAVLGVTEVRPEDDFFELGGHSLIAVDLIDQVHKLTGVTLTMSVLHRAPTVTALTDEILALANRPGGSE